MRRAMTRKHTFLPGCCSKINWVPFVFMQLCGKVLAAYDLKVTTEEHILVSSVHLPRAVLGNVLLAVRTVHSGKKEKKKKKFKLKADETKKSLLGLQSTSYTNYKINSLFKSGRKHFQNLVKLLF